MSFQAMETQLRQLKRQRSSSMIEEEVMLLHESDILCVSRECSNN